MLTLVLLGLLYNGIFENGFGNIRYASVLGQIGIAYFIAAMIVIFTSSFKSRLYWLGGILIGYAFIQLFIPIPGVGAGVLTPEGCINGYIDRMFLPGQLYGKVFDPEGLLCIISAAGITLMGSVAGHILKETKYTDWRKVYLLAIIGTALIIIALVIHPFYPIIKKCWTSTFNLMVGGISFLLMSLFYLIIDVLNWQKWSFFFRVIGMNSIFVYLLIRFIDFKKLSNSILGWTSPVFSNVYPFVNAIGAVALMWLLLYYMYKKKIFLRV